MILHRKPLCWINVHKPDRRTVRWDGLNFIGACDCCGGAIRRAAKNDWRKDWKPKVIFKLAA